jgi:anti-sigma B factor antagonist
MDIQIRSDSLSVSRIPEIVASNSRSFKDTILATLTPSQRVIEIDLSTTTLVDSTGLGALISLDKAVRARQGVVRLVNPSHSVQTILELTRLHRVFEVVRLAPEAEPVKEAGFPEPA